MRLVLNTIVLLLATACSNPPASPSDTGTDTETDKSDAALDTSPVQAALVDVEKWSQTALADDPFDDRPATVECEPGIGWGIEQIGMRSTVGVETEFCDYLSVSQPLLDTVGADETLLLHLYHFNLVGDGEAHVGVAIADDVVFETAIAIPADASLVLEEFELPSEYAEGTPVTFHLHNHGTNSWNLIDIRCADAVP